MYCSIFTTFQLKILVIIQLKPQTFNNIVIFSYLLEKKYIVIFSYKESTLLSVMNLGFFINMDSIYYFGVS